MAELGKKNKELNPKRKYRQGRREPVLLGIGRFCSQQEICDSIRIHFLLEVQDHAPKVLQGLAKQVLPYAGTEEYEDKLANWATTFQLVKDGEPADWVLKAARKTVESWKRVPSRGQRERLNWAPLGLSSAIRSSLSMEQTRIHLPELHWNPQLPPLSLKKTTETQLRKHPHLQFMTREEFESHAFKKIKEALPRELDRIESLLAKQRYRKENPLISALRLRSREGIEWAVRIQILKEEVWDIAQEEHTQPSNVITRARDILQLVGLAARPGSLDIYKNQNQ